MDLRKIKTVRYDESSYPDKAFSPTESNRSRALPSISGEATEELSENDSQAVVVEWLGEGALKALARASSTRFVSSSSAMRLLILSVCSRISVSRRSRLLRKVVVIRAYISNTHWVQSRTIPVAHRASCDEESCSQILRSNNACTCLARP